MREKYESLSLGALKEIARARGMKGLSSLKKSELVERMLQEDEKDKKLAEKKEAKAEVKKEEYKKEENKKEEHKKEEHRKEEGQEGRTARAPMEQSELDSGQSVQEFWKCFRTDMDLSAVITISRETMTFMYPLPRYGDST